MAPVVSSAGPTYSQRRPKFRRQARADFEIVLHERCAVVTAVVILHFAARSHAFAGLDGLYVAAAGGAEVIVGAEPQQEIAEGLEIEPAARRAGVVAPVVLGQEEAAGARLVPAVDPGQVIGPRVVFVLGGEIVAERAEEAETAQRTEHGHLRRLIEEAVGRRHPQGGGGRSAVAVRALRGAREAHAGFVHQGLAERGGEVEAGDIIVGGERLRSSRPRNHRRARVALRRSEGAVLIDGGEIGAGGERVLRVSPDSRR